MRQSLPCLRAAALSLLLPPSIAAWSCSETRPAQPGVEIFAEDTLRVPFTVTMAGTIEVRVLAERSYLRPDSSLVFETPATVLLVRGEGVTTIATLDPAQRIAVQPTGVSADSAERVGVSGRAIAISGGAITPRLALKVERP